MGAHLQQQPKALMALEINMTYSKKAQCVVTLTDPMNRTYSMISRTDHLPLQCTLEGHKAVLKIKPIGSEIQQ